MSLVHSQWPRCVHPLFAPATKSLATKATKPSMCVEFVRSRLRMPPFNPDSAIDLAVLAASDAASAPATVEQDVLLLFDRHGPPLLRYVASFGLTIEETEDVVQEVFLALFRHLRSGRSRANLKGW